MHQTRSYEKIVRTDKVRTGNGDRKRSSSVKQRDLSRRSARRAKQAR